MPVIAFNVKSDRIHDIKLEDGLTVGYLQELLAQAGYDVRQALVAVNRYEQEDKLIGCTSSYVLKEGDTVEFRTSDVSLPAIESEIGNLARSLAEDASAERARKEKSCGTACKGACSCSCKAHKDGSHACSCGEPKSESAGETAGGLQFRISKDSNGEVVIRVFR